MEVFDSSSNLNTSKLVPNKFISSTTSFLSVLPTNKRYKTKLVEAFSVIGQESLTLPAVTEQTVKQTSNFNNVDFLNESGNDEKLEIEDEQLSIKRRKQKAATTFFSANRTALPKESTTEQPETLYSVKSHIENQFRKSKIDYGQYKTYVKNENFNEPRHIFSNKYLKKMTRQFPNFNEKGKILLIECFGVESYKGDQLILTKRALFCLSLNNSSLWKKHEELWKFVEDGEKKIIRSLHRYFFPPNLSNLILSQIMWRSHSQFAYVNYPPDENQRLYIEGIMVHLAVRWSKQNVKHVLRLMDFKAKEKEQLLGNCELVEDFVSAEYYLNFSL